MKKRKVILLDRKESPWYNFLSEYFEDSAADLFYSNESVKLSTLVDTQYPDIAFINQDFLTLGLAQKLKIYRQSRPEFRLFHLGKPAKSPHDLPYDEIFAEPLDFSIFQKLLVQHLPVPEKIKILLIDDEEEIVFMMRDYLENRMHPRFEIVHAENGLKGVEALEKDSYDVIVLDVKMPVMNGREVYREIKTRGIATPVIVFFDAIFGDEMVEIHQYGKPAVVEKGARASAMPEMAALIKKMVYFG